MEVATDLKEENKSLNHWEDIWRFETQIFFRLVTLY